MRMRYVWGPGFGESTPYSEVIRSFLGAFAGDRTEALFQAQISIPPHAGHSRVQDTKGRALLGTSGGSGRLRGMWEGTREKPSGGCKVEGWVGRPLSN